MKQSHHVFFTGSSSRFGILTSLFPIGFPTKVPTLLPIILPLILSIMAVMTLMASSSQAAASWGSIYLGGGKSGISEKQPDQNYHMMDFAEMVLAYQYEFSMISFEKKDYEEQSATGNLSVKRHWESQLISYSWLPHYKRILTPTVSFGVGGAQESIDSRFASSGNSVDRSEWKLMSYAGLGMLLQSKMKADFNFWLSVEGRLYFGGNISSQPAAGAGAHAGIVF